MRSDYCDEVVKFADQYQDGVIKFAMKLSFSKKNVIGDLDLILQF